MDEEEIDLREYLKVIRKRWKTITAVFLLITLSASVIMLLTGGTYETEALLEIGRIKGTSLETVPLESIPALETLFKSPGNPYLKEIAEKMRIPLEESFKLSRKFEIKEKGGFLQIIGRGDSPENAKRFVDIISEVVMERHKKLLEEGKKSVEAELSDIQAQLDSATKEIKELNRKIEEKEKVEIFAHGLIQARDSALNRYSNIFSQLREKQSGFVYYTKATKIVSEAGKPQFPVSPKKRQNVLIAGFLGLIFGAFLAFFQEYLSKETHLPADRQG